MAEYGAVGGVEPLNDRYGPAQQHSERPPAHADDAEPRRPQRDSADLSAAAEAAYPLLRQRVLAATLDLLSAGPQPHPGTFWRAGAPQDPGAAVAWIQSEQRWLCAARAEVTDAALQGAFTAGLDETAEILGEVAHGEATVEHWLAAVRAHLRGSGTPDDG